MTNRLALVAMLSAGLLLGGCTASEGPNPGANNLRGVDSSTTLDTTGRDRTQDASQPTTESVGNPALNQSGQSGVEGNGTFENHSPRANRAKNDDNRVMPTVSPP